MRRYISAIITVGGHDFSVLVFKYVSSKSVSFRDINGGTFVHVEGHYHSGYALLLSTLYNWLHSDDILKG